MYMAHENPKDQKVLICKHNIACMPSDFIDLSHTLAITTHNGRKSQRSVLIGPNPFPISHSGAKGAFVLVSFTAELYCYEYCILSRVLIIVGYCTKQA